jgi:hypothetical protein
MEGTSSCYDSTTGQVYGSISGSGCTTCWSTEEDDNDPGSSGGSREKGGVYGANKNDETGTPVDNLKIPFSEWRVCSNLFVTATCSYGTSSLKLKFSNLDITTSPESVSFGDLSINRSGDLQYSLKVHSNFNGKSEFGSEFGVSFNSFNSIKVSGEMSVNLHEENASGNFTVGISHEYKPGNQVIMQTVGGALVALYLINPSCHLPKEVEATSKNKQSHLDFKAFGSDSMN